MSFWQDVVCCIMQLMQVESFSPHSQSSGSLDSPTQKRFAYGAVCQSADLPVVSGH